MRITLITDAGYCHRYRIGTWAAWARTAGKPIMRHSGVLRGEVDGSDIAEMRALVNGVALVLRDLDPPPGSHLLAQTDCQAAINAMLGTGYLSARAQRRIQAELEAMRTRIAAARISIEYRHVPGHAGKGTPRTAVNEWCDAECTRLLREARASARRNLQ